MKKRLGLVAVLAALMALTFVSCGVKESDIVGTWKVVEGEDMKGLYYEFKSTGEGAYWKSGAEIAKVPFEWTLKGDAFKIKYTVPLGKLLGEWDGTVKLSGNILEWTVYHSTFKFEKQ